MDKISDDAAILVEFHLAIFLPGRVISSVKRQLFPTSIIITLLVFTSIMSLLRFESPEDNAHVGRCDGFYKISHQQIQTACSAGYSIHCAALNYSDKDVWEEITITCI